ncbi:sorting nexin-14-like [Thalassophryne amazonica]|uniref:sorting nexin-14-like n=1 Tax=Thalassophryne amazonica TaxID=390379 RepID=UPI0014713C4A|nr:sorting nexin-14-like [Thalassophryne amazonica]
MMSLQKISRALRLQPLRELGRQYPLFCFLLLVLLLSTVLLNRYIHIIMVFWSFLAGVVTFYCSLGPESLLSNIFISIKPKTKSYQQELFPLGHSCAVCGKIKCKRHRHTLLLENYQPWLDLKVPSKVDASLSEILELVLENFVYPWYRDVTDDEAFVDELRVTLRFFAAVLVRRTQKVDVASLITQKLLKVSMKHIEIISKARQKVKNREFLQQAALEEYGTDLHVALRSRRDELLLFWLCVVSGSHCFHQDCAEYLLIYIFIFPLCVMQYFRQLLRGAESPTRNSKMSRNSLSLDDIRSWDWSPMSPSSLFTASGSSSPASFNSLHVQPTFTTFPSGSLSYRHSSPKNTSKRGESFGISRIGSKIKGVFKSTTMEGAMLPSYGLVEGEDDMVEEAMMVLEDDSPMEAVSTPSTPRNLSAWSITIPYIDFYEDDVKRERIPVFCIDVERNDRKAVGHETEHWSVYRRYLEFYVLESKLTEFHGSFPDAQLPSKRLIGPKNYEFLTSKREEFQEYLQRLLQHLELSNSQLLADFLSPYSMESQFLDKMLPDVNLGKIIKAVPSKLIKEKGQHLEPFIQSFFNSCESPKPKPSRPELTILSPTSENDKKLFNDLFKNNANRSETAEKRHNQNYFMEMISIEGVYDYLMYVGRVVFHIPDWLHHLLMAGRILFKNTLEAYTDYYLQYKLNQVVQEHRLVSLITLLRDTVFCESSQPRSALDKQKRAKKTFDEMMSYIPDLLGKCIGEEAKYEGVLLLFDGLQQPVLNKQLTYVLLDIAIQELFPELNKPAQKETSVMAPWM